MDKDFTEGFLNDVADLLQYCSENKTDTVELEFNLKGKILQVEISFKIKK